MVQVRCHGLVDPLAVGMICYVWMDSEHLRGVRIRACLVQRGLGTKGVQDDPWLHLYHNGFYCRQMKTFFTNIKSLRNLRASAITCWCKTSYFARLKLTSWRDQTICSPNISLYGRRKEAECAAIPTSDRNRQWLFHTCMLHTFTLC